MQLLSLSSIFLLFALVHLLVVSAKAADDESASLMGTDTEHFSTPPLSQDATCISADDDGHCYSDKKTNTVDRLLDETVNENVSAAAATVVTSEINQVATDSSNIITTATETFEQSSSSSPSSSACGAYLAESTIPNAGLGVFTARTISAGEMIMNSTEPVIQIEDVNMHTHRRLKHNGQLYDSSNSERPWLLNDLWLSSFATMGSFEADEVKSVVPGLASSCNYHPGGLVNLKRRPPRTNVASPLHRSNDPGTGASTTYHGLHFVARDDIQAGSELFSDYGESYFTMRKQKYGYIPLARDYQHADHLLAQLDEMVDSDFASTLAANVWKMITLTEHKDKPIIKALPGTLPEVVSLLKGNGISMDSVNIHFAKIYATSSSAVAKIAWRMLRNLVVQDEPERILHALPKRLSDVPLAIETGAAKFSLVEHSNVRSLDWLAKNGRCVDNLKPGKSNIPQAGYGAFATRRMLKGQVVAPVPVAQGLRKQMELYDNLNQRDPNSKLFLVGKQLILNYAFGHANSSLLLFPYGPVVNYLNHNSTSYNAELKWSDLPSHRTDWLERSPDELAKIDTLGLVLELVATRDIEAGEEVLIDYGSKWELAWKDHVEHWKPPKSASSYVPAAALNSQHEWLRTRAELILKPYPKNVQTVCHVAGPVRDESEGMAGATDWMDPGEQVLFSHTMSAFPCQVWERVIREEVDEHYRHYNGNQISHIATHVTLQELMAMDPLESDAKITYNVKVLRKEGNFFMKGLPRRAIQFFDKEYTSDQFLRNAFRHEMHLPDHLVPLAWKDLKDHDEY